MTPRHERTSTPGSSSWTLAGSLTALVANAARQGLETKREAERALLDLLHQLDTQRYVSPDTLTRAAFLRDEWPPAVHPPNLRVATWTSYRSDSTTPIGQQSESS